MRVYNSAEDYAENVDGPCVATLGTFDGYHLGHASIFNRINEIGDENGLPATAITFHPHPRVVVTPKSPPLLLTTPEEKVDILKDRFDGSLVFLKFDDKLREMTADEFVKNILIEKFRIKSLVVGYNHNFGKDRSGDIIKLREIGAREGFEVVVVDPVTFKDMPISSSRIRRAILNGEWKNARAMLGHPYPIFGTVIKGLGQGKKMGWPTINLEWSARKLLPAQGVYACSAVVNGEIYKGMMFIGINMLNPEKLVSVEANLFDFERDIYGEEVVLYPIYYIRDNRTFDSARELSRQIEQDKSEVLKLFK